MIRLLDKTKIPLFDYFYLLCVIIYAGAASAFVRELGDIRTVGNAFLLILSFLFAFHHRIRLEKSLLIPISILTVYSLCSIAFTHSSNTFLWIYSGWIIKFYIAYVVCKGYGFRFFIISETILYHLAIIAIICWILLLIFPSSFTELISSISVRWISDDPSRFSANVFFYTINIASIASGDVGFNLVTRNAGFAWEPGAFACFVCFGICFNAIRTNLRIKNNTALYVFLVALASTQSTTGFSAFFIMLACWLAINRKFAWLIIVLAFSPFVLDLPFMSEKIGIRSEGFEDATIDNAYQGQSFDRLLSLNIMFDEFLRHPWLGYGYSIPEYAKMEITVWSGIGQMLAQYGIFMFILFFFVLLKSSKDISLHYSRRTGIMIIITMLCMMISYHIWAEPFFISIWLLCIFKKKESLKLSVSNEICLS